MDFDISDLSKVMDLNFEKLGQLLQTIADDISGDIQDQQYRALCAISQTLYNSRCNEDDYFDALIDIEDMAANIIARIHQAHGYERPEWPDFEVVMPEEQPEEQPEQQPEQQTDHEN